MTYKTILLHVNDERRAVGLIEVATLLAARHDAHLIALYVIPPIPAYGTNSIGADYIETGLATFRAEAMRVRTAFEAECKGRSLSAEWRMIDPKHDGVAEIVMEHGHSADLIIASQRDWSWEFSMLLDNPERLAIESGRPVLVIPHSRSCSQFGKRVTLAWNGRREATRAAFDALPLLHAAESVRILWVNPQEASGDPDGLSTTDIAAALRRHGVKCEVVTSLAGELAVGGSLLSGLADDGSDLLVMGAYGHSRLREFVFGGATQHVLNHMTAPVLMSH